MSNRQRAMAQSTMKGRKSENVRPLRCGSVEPFPAVADFRTMHEMIDDPRKTSELIATLQNAAPFAVDLSPQLVATLKTESTGFDAASRYAVTEVSYAANAGGIMCRIISPAGGDAIVVSLTHLIVRKPLPFADAVAAYQRHRIKKLKKQR